jgi:hypothetical protein
MAVGLPVIIYTTSIDDRTIETFRVIVERLGLIFVPIEGSYGVFTVIVYEGGSKETSVHVWISRWSTNTLIIKGTSGFSRELGEGGISITCVLKESTSSILTPDYLFGLCPRDIIIPICIIKEG